MSELSDVLAELSKPFHPTHITWKPGVFNRDKTKALALPYADVRAYQNRLDTVCGMDWSVNYTPWGDRIVCHLTVKGVTRSSTGELDSRSEKSEIAGTAAEAQAFKRACAMFGLGRYLYSLPTVWAEFDSNRRQWTAQGKARLDNIMVQHYGATPGPPHGRHNEEAPAQPPQQPAPAHRPARAPAAQPADEPKPAFQHQLNQLHAEGVNVYGKEAWNAIRHKYVQQASFGRTESSNHITEPECQRIMQELEIDALCMVIYPEDWQEYKRSVFEWLTERTPDTYENTFELPQAAVQDLIAKLQRRVQKQAA